MVVLNPEGGGTIAGIYNGKQSPEFRLGALKGGNYCRWICNDLQRELDYEALPYFNICPELSNTCESVRVQRLNSYQIAFDTFALSIYTGTGERSGVRIYGNIRNRSEEIGAILSEELTVSMEGWQMPVGKIDYNHEHEYSILSKAQCPSFVIYGGSLDLYFDYSRMINVKYQQALVDALFNTIKKICPTSDPA